MSSETTHQHEENVQPSHLEASGSRSMAPPPIHISASDSGPVQRSESDVVELSYDDGPDLAGNTAEIVGQLEAGGANATFYLVGSRIRRGENWRLVFDIVKNGNWLGNHADAWNFESDNHHFLDGEVEERIKSVIDGEIAIIEALRRGRAEAYKTGEWERIDTSRREYIDSVIATGTGRWRTPGFRSGNLDGGFRGFKKGFKHRVLDRNQNHKTANAIRRLNTMLKEAGLRPYAVSDSVDIDPRDYRVESGVEAEGGSHEKAGKEMAVGINEKITNGDESILLHSIHDVSVAATPEILAHISEKEFETGPIERGEVGRLGSIFGIQVPDVPTNETLHEVISRFGQQGRYVNIIFLKKMAIRTLGLIEKLPEQGTSLQEFKTGLSGVKRVFPPHRGETVWQVLESDPEFSAMLALTQSLHR